MGINGFFKWLKKQFPLCLSNNRRIYSHCNTLFIDLCQPTIEALHLVENKMSDLPEEEQIQNYLNISVKKIKKIILTINPHDTIFAFLDGSSPAIKFQRKRERYFKSEYVENYVIDPAEYTLNDVNLFRDRLIVQKLFEYFTEMTTNCVYLRSNEILFSTFFSQGEAEHKYFEVFQSLKRSKNWKKNQLHSIFSLDNDLIVLALQFFDEHFLVLKDFNTIVDISILRDLFLYQMIQKDLFFIEENSEKNLKLNPKTFLPVVHELLNKIPIEIKKQIINDIMAMSFIMGSDFLPQIPDLVGISFSKLLNSYKKINEKYFLDLSNEKKSSEIEFYPLIVNDCFSVTSLQKLIRECFKDIKNENLNLNLSEMNIDVASQNMLRVFNFMWIYYMKGCPSWTYYYPFKFAPPISEAVERMKQEGPEVFDTPGSMVKTDNLFKTFVNHSIQYKRNLPWQLYRLKIPPSDIAYFWPLGVSEEKDVPMINLELLREVFDKEIKNVSKEELDYTSYNDNLYYTFYNYLKNKRPDKKQFYMNQQEINRQHQLQIQQQLTMILNQVKKLQSHQQTNQQQFTVQNQQQQPNGQQKIEQNQQQQQNEQQNIVQNHTQLPPIEQQKIEQNHHQQQNEQQNIEQNHTQLPPNEQQKIEQNQQQQNEQNHHQQQHNEQQKNVQNHVQLPPNQQRVNQQNRNQKKKRQKNDQFHYHYS